MQIKKAYVKTTELKFRRYYFWISNGTVFCTQLASPSLLFYRYNAMVSFIFKQRLFGISVIQRMAAKNIHFFHIYYIQILWRLYQGYTIHDL